MMNKGGETMTQPVRTKKKKKKLGFFFNPFFNFFFNPLLLVHLLFTFSLFACLLDLIYIYIYIYIYKYLSFSTTYCLCYLHLIN